MRFWVLAIVLALAAASGLPAAGPSARAESMDSPVRITWSGSSLKPWSQPVVADHEAASVRSYSAFRASAYNPPKGKNLQIVNLGGGRKAIKITTRRHCTKTANAELVAGFNRAKGQNEYRTACPKGTFTRYSTGRIDTPASLAIPVGGTTIEARVKLPANAVRGVRFAVWAGTSDDVDGQLDNTGYCSSSAPSTNLLEVDVLEWYGGAKNINHAHVGDHVGCENPLGTLKAHTVVKGGKGWVKRWHTVAVATGGASDTYLIDGKAKFTLTYQGNEQGKLPVWMGSGTSAPTEADWVASHSSLARYVVVVQGEVFRSVCSTRFCRPDPKKPFPAQSMLVDWVRVTIAPTPLTSSTSASSTPTPAPVTSTGSPSPTPSSTDS